MVRPLARLAALACVAVVAAFLSPLSVQADPSPIEMQFVCAQKSSGALRYVTNATSCTKSERLVTIKPGPVTICVQPPSGPTKFVSSASLCKKPATALTLPPTSGTIYFCVTTSSGAVRYVTGPGQCAPTEFQVQVTPTDAAPAVTSTSPASAAVATTTASITITFSESVGAPATAFAVVCDSVGQPFTLSGLPGTVATLDPVSDLPMGGACTVTTTGSQVSDTDANDPPDTMAANHSFSFTVDAAPAFVSSVPDTGATNVAVDATFTVTFSEPVTASATAFTFECPGLTTPGLATGSPGASIDVTPSSDLFASSQCQLVVHADQITDVDTVDPPDQMVADQVILFTTADPAPAVSSTVPLDGAGNVPTDTTISVSWSESVAATAGAIAVSCAASPVAGALSGSPGSTITFTPTSDLPEGVACTVTVEADNITDTDAVDPPDNPASDHTFTFTTDARPTVASTTPADGATNASASGDITVAFSEPVTVTAAAFTFACNAVPVSFVLTGSGTDTITLNPSSDLPGTSSCTVTAVAANITDTDLGDPPDTMAANHAFSFSTVDTAPSVTATTPADGATNATVAGNVTVTFSEAVAAGTGAFAISCDATAVDFAVTEGASNVWTLDPTSNFAPGAVCTVTVAAAGITDVDVIDPPDNMAVDHVFGFTVSPNSAPTNIALSANTVAENAPTVTTIGTLTTTDPDAGDTFTYSLASGTGDTDNGSFTIVGDVLKTSASFDFESQPTLSVRVRTTDSGSGSFEKSFSITVTDVNEAPTDLTLSATAVDENQPIATVVGTLGAVDPDAGQTHTFSLASAGCGGGPFPDNAAFAVSGVELRTAVALNFEVKSSYAVCLRVTDSGAPALARDETATITVNDINDAPVAGPDSYSGVIGNTLAVRGVTGTGPHVVLTGDLPLVNDSDEDAGDSVSIVAGTVASTGGGTATIAADGTFSYLPGPGDKSQNDTFTYQLTDGDATVNGTVTMTIGADLVWYVNNAVSPATPDGRSSSPYTTLAPLSGAADADSPNETIFVYTGTSNYAGGIALEAGQNLLGSPAGLVIGATTLVTAGGVAPVITNGAGNGIGLANGVDVQGVSVSGASGDGINGVAVTTATVGTTSPVTVSGSLGDGVDLNGAASGSITVAATVTGSATRSVNVSGRTGGTTTFSGPITGTGISVTGNTGATVAFTGKLAITTSAAPTFEATGGGTVTSTHVDSTLASTSVRALNVDSTTIGAAGLTFKSISASGAVNGIRLNNTGDTAGLTVLGTGSVAVGGDASGGTIQNMTGVGVSLAGSRDVSLRNLTISNTTGGAGVLGTDVTNFAFTNGTVNGSGSTSHGLFDSNIAFNSAGGTANNVDGTVSIIGSTLTDAYQHGVDITNRAGTISSLTIRGNAITSATSTTDSVGSGILVNPVGSASTVGSVTRGSISSNTIVGFPFGGGINVLGGNSASPTAPAATIGSGSGANALSINGNLIRGHSLANPLNTNCILLSIGARATAFVDVTNNGTAGSPLAFNKGNCISVNVTGSAHLTSQVTGNVVKPQSQLSGTFGIAFGSANHTFPDLTIQDTAVLDINVTGNDVSSTTGNGIRAVTLNQGTLRSRIMNNTVAAPTDQAGVYGIRIHSGAGAGSDTVVCVQVSGNTTAGSLNSSTGQTAPGIGLRKEGQIQAVNEFGIVGLAPSPATALQTDAYVDGQNPGSSHGSFSSGVQVISGSNYQSCTLPAF